VPDGASRWRVLIADDEPAARRGVRQLLAAFPAFAVVGECRDGAEALAALDREGVDLLFLDIQMPEIDGFEVIRRRKEAMPVVVFLTAFDQFALAAFEAAALDYLVKPVSEARFAETMRRVVRQLNSAPGAEATTLTVTAARGMVMLPVTEIDWIEAADNYVRVWAEGKGYLLRRPMRELERAMRRHGFIRAHRQAIVRLQAVRRLAPTPDGDLIAVLSSGAEIPIARRRRAAFAAAVRGGAG
jgi:two-component system LytT family response regulator